jgi:hypothetical protein
MEIIFTEQCLVETLWHVAEAGWLSPEELAALKQTDGYDPALHREDGSIAGAGTEDMRRLREGILHHLNRVHPALKHIIAAEIKNGSRVHSASADYPETGSITVGLTKEFTGQYQNDQVTFRLCNDPHYWYAQYTTTAKPTHLLIC